MDAYITRYNICDYNCFFFRSNEIVSARCQQLAMLTMFTKCFNIDVMQFENVQSFGTQCSIKFPVQSLICTVRDKT